MTWYGWSFLILLLLAWLLLFYHCLRFLDCCPAPRTLKGTRRDSDGRLLACTFCHIAQQHPPPTPPSPSSPTASLPPSPPSPSLPPTPSSSLYLIPDPSLPLPLPAPSPSHHPPTPILYSTPWVVCFSPRSPAATRHLLIVPKLHIDDCVALAEGARDPPHPAAAVDEEGGEWAAEAGSVAGEEEKDLTPLQLLDHMLEVGRFVLSHPHLMADAAGGVPVPRARRRLGQRLCGWKGRGRGQGGKRWRDGEDAVGGKGDGEGCGVGGAATGVRRRWAGSSPVAPVETQPEAGSADEGRGSDGEVEGQAEYRFAFHAPPHNSIAHLHLHCFELPFVSVWDEWSFRPHTRWCREAAEVREDIIRRERLAGG